MVCSLVACAIGMRASSTDEMADALRLYGSQGDVDAGNASATADAETRPLKPKSGAQKRKAPRTHLHAEMVARRRNPEPSPKTNVHEALHALKEGDSSAVDALLSRAGEEQVPEEWQDRYKNGGQMYWDHFYVEKTVNFFKDRNYLRDEFGELMPPEILENPKKWVDQMVCAAGQGLQSPRAAHKAAEGVLPMLRFNPALFGYACDLSPVAIKLLQEKEEYNCGRCLAFPCDVTKGEHDQPTSEHRPMETLVPADTVDFATLLFVLSAIDPACHRSVLARIRSRLRPGGILLIRDYGRGDLAQLRFGKGHWLGGDLYVRGDGTLSHFQTVDGLVDDLKATGFEVVECEYRTREIVNRGTGVVMPRVWVQGKFRRPLGG
eukprot:TRINITY_DN21878_c0_g1_i1.p1 TRINITY_DN21878_c0_g1~~TRINITY_DN21878_c0_g1_i1.p1  ORF type:complete len:378 (+),score=82.48 TRINITY_DN21878_c0_g1_i1:44-1177(+)